MEDNTVVRPYTSASMDNKYYKVLEWIDMNAWMEDAVVCPYLAEDLLEEDYISEYNHITLAGDTCYVHIVEAFDKVWVFLNTYGDPIDTMYTNKDGSVYGCSEYPSLDLGDGTYYAGDEISFAGERTPFETDQQWAWNSVEVNCKAKMLTISKDTMVKFIELREEYLQEQAEEV